MNTSSRGAKRRGDPCLVWAVKIHAPNKTGPNLSGVTTSPCGLLVMTNSTPLQPEPEPKPEPKPEREPEREPEQKALA